MMVIAPPPLPPELDEIEQLEALIEEARRRARRRRRRYGALALLAALAAIAAYAGLTRGPVEGTPLADPPPRIDPLPVPTTVGNGALTIMAVEANAKHESPPGWYGLSAIGPDGRLQVLVRCPNRVKWCGAVESIDWAPDGRRLALSVTSFGLANPYNGIHVIDMETGIDHHVRKSSLTRREGDWFDLDWSPDSTRLAFVSHGVISIINANGSGRRTLHTGTEGRDWSPSWSPDGDWIAYQTGRWAGRSSVRGSVYVIRTDGSRKRLLRENAVAPAWSPQGTPIAVRVGCGIKLITPAGRDVTPPSPFKCNAIGVRGTPAWSPDGTKIAIGGTGMKLLRWRSALPRGTFVMNADGTELTRLTPEALGVVVGQYARPAWRPLP
jgi:hypothetical protein